MTIAYFNIHKFWQQMSPHLDYGEQEEHMLLIQG